VKRVGLWWCPLLLAMMPSCFGVTPQHRDIPSFFVPMRTWTASTLASGDVPWLNPHNGIGEPWFANPETGVLYPPTWLYVVLPRATALALEVGLHLAWLSLGVGLLAAKWGSGPTGRRVAEVAAWSAGPVLSAVGVLNNLDTLSWLPWMVLAGGRKDGLGGPAVALTVALGWLSGEPQLWAIGVILILLAGRCRTRVLAGVGLALAMVSVQMVPFLAWVAEGDRVAGGAAQALRAALRPDGWLGLVAPSMTPFGGMIYVESLFLSAPLLAVAIVGARRRPLPGAIALGLFVVATLPAIGLSGLYIAVTGGLVRYPSRFAMVGAIALLPLLGAGFRDWMEGRGRVIAIACGVLGVVAGLAAPTLSRGQLAALPAVVLLVAALRPTWPLLRFASVVVGLVAVIAAGLPVLDLLPVTNLGHGTVWPEARATGRLWAPAPSPQDVAVLAKAAGATRVWPIGYWNLEDGVSLATTSAPVVNRHLAAHLAEADRGPVARWWIDSLGVRWVVVSYSAPVPEDWIAHASRGGRTLWANPRGMPVARLVAGRPAESRNPTPLPSLVTIDQTATSLDVRTLSSHAGVLWISRPPMRGWSWRLDGRPVSPMVGPGILQSIAVAEGRHTLAGVYRVPGAPITGWTSCLALLWCVAWLGRTARPWHGITRGSRSVAASPADEVPGAQR
jgi:hypothetical protein